LLKLTEFGATGPKNARTDDAFRVNIFRVLLGALRLISFKTFENLFRPNKD